MDSSVIASCPDDETLAALIDSGLGDASRDRLGHHIDGCAQCRRLVAALIRADGASGATNQPGTRSLARGTTPPPPRAEGPLDTGTTVGRYLVARALGTGGMGMVYEAYDPELERRVALKVLRPELGELAAGVERRLVRESKAQARLSHANVVAVYDVGTFEGQVFIAMELIDGHTMGEWLRAEPRNVADILDVFVRAGRGLQAAHEAGLVHRDFKPDNVLIGDDGRVCVADFGLARAFGASHDDTSDAEPAAISVSSSLTHTGTVVGTPAYMAPEQQAGRPTDARTDVFSFCVALYEALYGERPFPGTHALELRAAIARGDVQRPPRGSRVPAWLRRVVLRGLRAAPEDRYPSMRALLRALVRARRPWLLAAAGAAGAALVTGAVLVYAIGGGDTRHPTCDDDRASFARVWDDERRDRVRESVLAVDSPEARARWRQIERSIDRFAAEWSATRVESCEATRAGHQSEQMLDQRAQCLDDQLTRLGHVTSLLEQPDPQMIEYALDSLRGIPRLDGCSAAALLHRAVPEPADRETREQVDAIRVEIARGDVLRLAGRYADAQAVLEPLAERAAATAYRPIEADALYALGIVRWVLEELEPAHDTLRRAAYAAEAGRHDERAVDSWTALIEVAAISLGDAERARDYAERARAGIERLGGDVDLEVRLDLALGMMYAAENDYDRARVTLRRAADDSAGGSLLREEAMSRLGNLYEDTGELDEALATHEFILAQRIDVLGPDHPDVALAHTHLASVLMQVGRVDEALEHTQRTLAINEAVFGPDHIDTARARHNVGDMLSRVGRYEDGLDELTRSLAVLERERGPNSADVGLSLIAQGELLVRVGRAPEAVALTRRALRIYEAVYARDSFENARCLINLGDALREAADYDEALIVARRGLSALEGAIGADTPYSGYGLTGIGRILLDRGDPAAAIEPLARAVELYAVGGVDPEQEAVTRFALGRAYHESGLDRDRGVALVEQARAELAAAGRSRALEVGRADGWLARRSR